MLVGISSGATLAAILQKLPDLPDDVRVLGFNYDTGERYLSVPDFLPESVIAQSCDGMPRQSAASPLGCESPRCIPHRDRRAMAAAALALVAAARASRSRLLVRSPAPSAAPRTRIAPPHARRARRPSCRRSSRSRSSDLAARRRARVQRHACPSRPAQPRRAPVPLRRQRRRPARARSTASPPAVIYEAGDDADGRARGRAGHPQPRCATPPSPRRVCGVVFQGSERRTGCQFTFTCDGAIDPRRRRAAAWDARARDRARGADRRGRTRRVGHATHYHTDWVVPYWSRASTRSPRSTRICSSAGPAGGARRRRFAAAMPAPSRRSPQLARAVAARTGRGRALGEARRRDARPRRCSATPRSRRRLRAATPTPSS